MISIIYKFKWAILLVLAILVGIVLVILKFSFSRSSITSHPDSPVPEVPKPLLDMVQKAEEDALVKTAEAHVHSNDQTAQMKQIAAIDDGAERRKQLASFIKGLS